MALGSGCSARSAAAIRWTRIQLTPASVGYLTGLEDRTRDRLRTASLQDVRQALSRNNANSSGGILRQHAEQYLIRGVGLIRSVDDIGKSVLREFNGTPVHLDDVADVQIGDTVTEAARPTSEPFPGFQEVKPMVFAGLYPIDSAQYEDLRDAMDKLPQKLHLATIWLAAVSEQVNAEQAALRSNPHAWWAPILCCSRQAVLGNTKSGVEVAQTIRSMSEE